MSFAFSLSELRLRLYWFSWEFWRLFGLGFRLFSLQLLYWLLFFDARSWLFYLLWLVLSLRFAAYLFLALMLWTKLNTNFVSSLTSLEESHSVAFSERMQ